MYFFFYKFSATEKGLQCRLFNIAQIFNEIYTKNKAAAL